MTSDPGFYTVTMARVYEEQGYLDKAAEIYRFLLKTEPQRRDLLEALAAIDRKRDAAVDKKPDDLIPLFREWIRLLIKHSRLQKLRQLKGGL
jgi:hypothetical protein